MEKVKSTVTAICDNAPKTQLNLTLWFLVLALLVSTLVAVPIVARVNAQGSWSWVTHTYISVNPNPVGQMQTVNVIIWLDHAPPQTTFFEYHGWNFTLTITDPTGEVMTAGPIESDSTGGATYTFTPSMIGVYQIQAHLEPATINVTSPVGLMLLPQGIHYFQESSSRVVELAVQEEPVESWPEVPLPSDYWERPINAEFRGWHQIAGNWLGLPFGGSYVNKYTMAPESPHIVWTKELTFGGIVGGEAGWGTNFYTGLLYENKFTPYIIAGRLYYNMFWQTFGAGEQLRGVVCVDLRTGEEIWRNEEMPQISAAQIVIFNSGTQSGATAYLWSAVGSDWQIYDAYTGRLLTTITNCQGGLAPIFGPNGEILVYILDGANNRLVMWNSTLCITSGAFGFSAQTYQPYSRTSFDWSSGVQYNVSIPDVPGVQSTGVIDAETGVLVAESVITVNGSSPTFVHVGYDLKTGEQIWVKNWTNVGWGAGGTSAAGLIGYWGKGYGEGAYMFFEKETMQWHVIDITTGEQMWVMEPLNTYTNSDWSVYDWSVLAADGKLFTSGQSGCVVAFDLKTGSHLWTFSQGSSGLMTPYGTWPHFGRLNYADGKVYFAVTEHTPTSPIYRGYRMYCLNGETGERLWEIPGFYNGESFAIADGYLLTYNGYDNRIYCFGKGKTSTEVSVSPKVIASGEHVLIEGTVTDQSPGAKDFPAVADESMTAWMEYVYMQKECPIDVMGVPVKLEVVEDPNGNYYDIGTATTDTSGFYSIAWQPPVPGHYIIKATFAGSESYYPSSAETSIYVAEAPSPAAPIEPEQPEQPTQPTQPEQSTEPEPTAPAEAAPLFSTTDLAIIAAVAVAVVVGVASLYLLRRRK